MSKMSKLAKSSNTKAFQEVGRKSAEKANAVVLKNIADEDLIDYPRNNEDLSDTTDLENSIDEIGFTDPIEVTTFGQPEGKFMIVSGHRRRVAGRNKGMEFFPSIIKTFNSDEEVHNYVLLSNSQRDTAKDPLLFCKRYKMHEEYLKSKGFKGSIVSEIAKRLGVSKQQAERYAQMNKVISPIWDMVKDDLVGMSSVLPLATLSTSEQAEVLEIFNDCIADNKDLTRPLVKEIVDGFKEGKMSYDEIFNSPELTQKSMAEEDFEHPVKELGNGYKPKNEHEEYNEYTEFSELGESYSEDDQISIHDDERASEMEGRSRGLEIKPCPFCGGYATHNNLEQEHHYIHCVDCGARTKDHDTVYLAIEKWNSRM